MIPEPIEITRVFYAPVSRTRGLGRHARQAGEENSGALTSASSLSGSRGG